MLDFLTQGALDLGCLEPLGYRVLGACWIQGVGSMLDSRCLGSRMLGASGIQGVGSLLDSVCWEHVGLFGLKVSWI